MPRPIAKRREYYQREIAVRDMRRANGFCFECSDAALPGRTRCWKHALMARLAALKRDGVLQVEVERARVAIEKFSGICDACYGTDCGAWRIDHDHETKKFRGIVGNHCNLALGMLKDDPRTLRRLARYLEKYLWNLR